MRQSSSWHRVLGFAVLAIFLVHARADAVPQKLEKITIAVLPSDSTSQAYVAYDRGAFRAVGLDVDIQSLNSGPVIATAVATNTANFGAANLISLAVAYREGLPFVLVAPAGTTTSEAPTIGLVVAKSSPIVSARDLNGKTIAVDSLKSLATTGTSAWVDENGGDSRTLKFIEIPFVQMDAALAAGRVDAAFLPEPLLTTALDMNARLLAAPLSAISKELLVGAWFTTAEYARAHPDIVRKFAEVMARTATWINANPAASAAILQRYTKSRFTDRTHRMRQGGSLDAHSLQPLIDAAVRYGVLDKPFPAVEMIAPQLDGQAA